MTDLKRLQLHIAAEQANSLKDDEHRLEWIDLWLALGQDMNWQSHAFQRLLKDNPDLLESAVSLQ